MNRSILVVICDFLLVSLLVFSSVDINKVAENGSAQPMGAVIATNRPDAGNNLAAVMKLALNDEQKRRELLQSELEKTRSTASEREKQLQSISQQLQSTEQQKQNLQQQFASAQTNIATLSQQVRSSSTDASMTREKLAALEAELKRREAEAARLQQETSKLQANLTTLAESNQMVLKEKQQLSTQLQVAEVEKRHATEQVVAMKEQVKVEREEKAKLTEGIKALATNSTQLVQEIRENRQLTPNTIFDEFTANRVRASFTAFRSGFIDTNKRKDAGTVLATDGTNVVALCHVEDTPLTFWIPGTQWESLSGTLTREAASISVRSLCFQLQDPRIVYLPISAADARKLGGKIYHVSTTPYKFQDAVLVGANVGYYGECRFEIDVNAPAYVKLDRSLVKGLFGKFNPSRGDLVFAKTGELLGIMANNTYCLLLQHFETATTVDFGPDVRAQRTGDTLAALYNVVQQLPVKLQ